MSSFIKWLFRPRIHGAMIEIGTSSRFAFVQKGTRDVLQFRNDLEDYLIKSVVPEHTARNIAYGDIDIAFCRLKKIDVEDGQPHYRKCEYSEPGSFVATIGRVKFSGSFIKDMHLPVSIDWPAAS